MRRLVWAFGWLGVLIWSLVCALAYGFFDLVGRAFMRNADSFSSSPEVVEGLFKLFSFLHGLSTGGVLVGWAIVSLLILAVPWVIDRMLSGPGVRVTTRRVQATWPPQPRRDGVIDLGPGDYEVASGPRGGTPRGALPPSPPAG